MLNLALITNANPNNLKVSFREVNGFDPAADGGWSLCGRFIKADEQLKNGSMKYDVSAGSGCPLVVEISEQEMANGYTMSERIAILLEYKPNQTGIMNTVKFQLPKTGTEAEIATDALNIRVIDKGVTSKEAHNKNLYHSLNQKYPAMFPVEMISKLSGPYYYAGATLLNEGTVTFGISKQVKKESSISRLTEQALSTTPPSADDIALDAHEYGLIKETSKLPTLPKGWAWANVVSGVYFVVREVKNGDRKMRMLFLDAVLKDLKIDYQNEEWSSFMQEQADLLIGMGTALNIMASVMNNGKKPKKRKVTEDAPF